MVASVCISAPALTHRAGTAPKRTYRIRLRPDAQYLAQTCRGSRPKARYASSQLALTACGQGYYQLPWTIGQNVLLATGQGYLLASPLQMAIAYSAIVNGGKVFSPKIGTEIGLVATLLGGHSPLPTTIGYPVAVAAPVGHSLPDASNTGLFLLAAVSGLLLVSRQCRVRKLV